jgi:hypothetical protein
MVGLQLILILWILFHSLAQAWSSEDDGDLLSFVTVSIPAHQVGFALRGGYVATSNKSSQV